MGLTNLISVEFIFRANKIIAKIIIIFGSKKKCTVVVLPSCIYATPRTDALFMLGGGGGVLSIMHYMEIL